MLFASLDVFWPPMPGVVHQKAPPAHLLLLNHVVHLVADQCYAGGRRLSCGALLVRWIVLSIVTASADAIVEWSVYLPSKWGALRLGGASLDSIQIRLIVWKASSV